MFYISREGSDVKPDDQNDAGPAEILTREVEWFLIGRELLSGPALAVDGPSLFIGETVR
jgi:hypothetical protein